MSLSVDVISAIKSLLMHFVLHKISWKEGETIGAACKYQQEE